MSRKNAKIDKELKKTAVAEKVYETLGYSFPDFESYSVSTKLLKERVHNAERFSNRICFIRENIALFTLVKARIKELDLSYMDIAMYLNTDKANVWRFFRKGNVGSLSQAKYLLLLELLSIQTTMTFKITDKFDRKARYGLEGKKED